MLKFLPYSLIIPAILFAGNPDLSSMPYVVGILCLTAYTAFLVWLHHTKPSASETLFKNVISMQESLGSISSKLDQLDTHGDKIKEMEDRINKMSLANGFRKQ